MPATLPFSPAALEQPLPAGVVGRTHGWLARYRNYPVYSAAWARGRTRTMLLICLPLYVAVMSPALFAHRDLGTPLGGILQTAVQVFAPILLGPWLGWSVRRRGLPEREEIRALAAAMVALIVAILAFHQWAAEPIKQQFAEWNGRVDPVTGKRKPVVMQIGVVISSPDEPRRAADADRQAPPGDEATLTLAGLAINATVGAMLTFWLGGGAGLWAWRRERDGLRALQREAELGQANAERREAELRLSVLAAQVEPHFLFNTLAGVRSAIATDPARASEMIDRLVDYLRASIPRLRSDGSVQATVGAQLEIVRAYLELTAARMPRLKVEIRAPQELLGARCPPLMLISLAENAVKHGIERKIGPATIAVVVERIGDDLCLRVIDDGAGFPDSAGGSGIGLANIRERLAQLHPGRATLSLKSRPEGGVEAAISLPLEFPSTIAGDR